MKNRRKNTPLFIWLSIILGLEVLFLILVSNKTSIKLLLGGIFFVILGIDIFLEKNSLKKLSGGIFISIGIFTIIFSFNFFLIGILFFLISIIIGTIFNFFSLKKNYFLFSFFITIIYDILALSLFYPFIQDFFDIFFKRNITIFSITFLIIILIFIFISALFTIIYLLQILSNILKKDKINNIYLALSLTIILMILFSGVIVTRQIYLEDYPFNVEINENFGKLEDCHSLNSNVYFKTGDIIECKLISNLENINASNIQSKSIEVKRNDEWYFREYNNDGNENYKVMWVDQEKSGSLQFRLDENIINYRLVIFHDYPNESYRTRYSTKVISINPVSEFDYKQKQINRLLWLIAIFSVFSAIRSLQEILGQNR